MGFALTYWVFLQWRSQY